MLRGYAQPVAARLSGPRLSCPDIITRGGRNGGRRSTAHPLRLHGGRPEQRGTLCASGLESAVGEALVAALRPHPGLLPGAGVNSLVYVAGIKVLLRGLTPAGVAHSWVLGTAVYAAFGFSGYLLVCLYFIAGSAVTKIKMAEKEAEGIAEARSGRRSPWSVWGSGIAALACAGAALATGEYDLWQVGFVASVASKLSDTVSSELGKAYGRTTFLATNFRVVPRGTEGAVSLEGTAAGVAAAIAFCGLALAFGQVTPAGCLICIAAAVVANYFESYLGASVQGGVPWLTNDVVNMIQISLAAALALGAQVAVLQL